MREGTFKFIEGYIMTLASQKEPIGQARLIARMGTYSKSTIGRSTRASYGYRIKAILSEKGLINEYPTHKKSVKNILFTNEVKNTDSLALEVYEDFRILSRGKKIPKYVHENVDLPEKVEWFILIRDGKVTLMRNDNKIAIIPIGKKAIGINLSKEAVIAFKQY